MANGPHEFVFDSVLNYDDKRENGYMEFKDSCRRDSVVPVLINDKVLLYKFSLTETSKDIFDKLVEIKDISDYTNLQHVVDYYDGAPRIIVSAPGKRELKFEEFKDFLTKKSMEGYIRTGESVETAFNNWKNLFRACYVPAHKEKIGSKVSQAFYWFCKYPSIDFLAEIIYEYLYNERRSFSDVGPNVVNEGHASVDRMNFNKTELDVVDKKSLICEVLKSLNVELLLSMNIDEESDFVLGKIFNSKICDIEISSGDLREFIKEFAMYNSDILFNSELFDIFNELSLQKENVKGFYKSKGSITVID